MLWNINKDVLKCLLIFEYCYVICVCNCWMWWLLVELVYLIVLDIYNIRLDVNDGVMLKFKCNYLCFLMIKMC